MKNFDYFQPTQIHFGRGRINEVGKIASAYGKRCLVVTTPLFPPLQEALERVKNSLEADGVEMFHFDGVVPNPTTDSITAGAEVARQKKVDVVIGLGGGSSMDSAKAIAVEATHQGTCWDYLWFSETQPTEKTLPVVAVTTTSGTGSHVTQVAVVTNSAERNKSALYNSIIYPKAAIVDPELMATVPQNFTAFTGFDVLCHAFEAWLNPNCSPYIAMMAKEVIKSVIENLPAVYNDGTNLEAREAMAWADTLAGLCIANAGVTLPHGMGMAIGGMYPNIAHGQAMAIVYPAFARYTWDSAVKQFAFLCRCLDTGLDGSSDSETAEKSCGLLVNFLKSVGLYQGLEENNVPKEELDALAKQCMVLPDYKANPRVATLEDMRKLLEESYTVML